MKRKTIVRSPSKQSQAFKPKLSVIAASIALALSATPSVSETISGEVTSRQAVATDQDLTITQMGTVNVTETGNNPTTVGVDFGADYTGKTINQGKISADAVAATGTANATALNFMGGVAGGEILNSGPISAKAIGGVEGSDVGVTAKGVYIPDGMTAGSVFTGTGTIKVDAAGGNAVSINEAVSTSVENTYGIFVNGVVDGASLSQSGNVSLTAVGGNGQAGVNFSANTRINQVAGVRISSSGIYTASTIRLSGDVTVNAKAGNSTASADGSDSSIVELAGVRFYGAYGQSSVSNSGNISVVGQAGNGAGDGSARLYVEKVGALYAGTVTNGSSLTNNGRLNVVVNGGSEAAGSLGRKDTYVRNVAGMLFDRSNISNDSVLRNTGDIHVQTASGGTTGNAYIQDVGGIQFYEGYVGNGSTLVNTADISVRATAVAGGARANANSVAGISLQSLEGRTIENNQVDYGELTNSGDISVVARAGRSTALDVFDNADASASNIAGILISGRGLMSGKLLNTGDFSISATGGVATGAANGNANADAIVFGVRVARHLESTAALPNTGSTLSNSGNILVSAAGGVATADADASASAYAYGVRIQDSIKEDSVLTNSGSITAIATAGNATGATVSKVANAYAVHIGSISKTSIPDGEFAGAITTGTVKSTGNLNGRAFGNSGIGAGLYVNGTMDGDVTLQGMIKGVGATQSVSDSYAIYFGSGTGNLAINAPTYFVGSLKMAEQNVTLTSGKAHSVHWKFDGGGAYTLRQGDGVPWFSRNGNTQSGEYATYDPSGQALQDQVVASVARFGDHHMRRHLQANNAGSGKAQTPWAYVGTSDNDFTGKAASVNHFGVRSTGLVGGVVMNNDHDVSLGLMGGVVASKGQASGVHVATQTLDASSAFVGASLGKSFDGLMLHGGLKLGYTEMDGARMVNYNMAIPQDGLERAKSDFRGKWTAATLGAGYTIAINEGLSITPSANVGFVHAKLGGYSESGATANATLGGRNLRLMTSDIGVQIKQQLDKGVLRGSLAYVGNKTSGPETVNVGLIGDTQAVAIQRANYSAPKLGLGYTYQAGKNLTVNLDGSKLLSNSYKGMDFSARVNWNF